MKQIKGNRSILDMEMNLDGIDRKGIFLLILPLKTCIEGSECESESKTKPTLNERVSSYFCTMLFEQEDEIQSFDRLLPFSFLRK